MSFVDLLLLAILKELVVVAAFFLYIFVVYPKPAATGFYSRSTGNRLFIVAMIAFFPFFVTFWLLRIPWKATAKLIRLIDE